MNAPSKPTVEEDRLNIVLLVPEFPPDSIGGGGVVFEALADAYAEAGHEVTVVAGASTPDIVDDRATSLHRVVRITELPTPDRFPWLRTTLPPRPGKLSDLHRYVSAADVVHAHGYGFPTVDLGILLASFCGVPVLQTLHGHPVSQDRHGPLLKAAFTAYSLLGNAALRRAQTHTAVSAGASRVFVERFGLHPSVVPNGVSLPAPEPWAELAVLRRPIVLCVGRLEWLKGLDVVIDAVGRLDEPPDLLFVGADNGEGVVLRERAQHLGISDRCHFVGAQSRPRVVSAYAVASAVVMASRVEAFPGVPLEAMAAGVPLVATELPAVSSYARDGENCLLVPVDDPTALATAMARVLTDLPLRRTLIERGRSTAEQFAWSSVAHRYLERLQELAREGRPKGHASSAGGSPR